MVQKECGFSQIVLIIILAFALLGGGATWYYHKPAGLSKQTEEASTNPPTSQPAIQERSPEKVSLEKTAERVVTSESNLLSRTLNHGQCVSSGPVSYTAAPMRPQDIALFVPLGLMVGGHVTPVDHQYFYPVGWRSGNQEVPIFAPASGNIVSVIRYASGSNIEGLASRDGYDIVIEHSCTFYSKLGLLTGLEDEIAKQLGLIGRGQQKSTHIPVTAGQEVARVGGQSLDFFTFDIHTPQKHWIVPEHYNDSDGIKKYITDGLLYFPEQIKTEILAKNPRTVEPRGGRFDYDIDGRLVGTWFLKGSGGYIANDPTAQGYWKGHLVFAYNEIDPSSIEISMGSWAGSTSGSQFAVKTNAPDPKDISVASGLIKYELTNASFITVSGEGWIPEAHVGPVRRIGSRDAIGAILVQMLNDRLIKVEKFPGKKSEEVTGFSSAAELYER